MRRILTRISRRLFPPTQVIEGYENPELVDSIVRKTEAYKPSEHIDIGDAATVLDFGGGSGRHFKEANSPSIKWAVVETPTMARSAGKLETQHLKFFTSINDAVSWLGAVDLMHSNGAVQYTDDPLGTVRALVAVGAREMRWSRLYFSDDRKQDNQTSFLSDNGPGNLRNTEKFVQYQRIAMAERDFVSAHEDYKIISRGRDWFVFRA